MPNFNILPFQYFEMQTEEDCGAACAKMVLKQIGSGNIGQSRLYREIHSFRTIDNLGWFSSPDGLEHEMNDENPNPGAYTFKLLTEGSKTTISRKIIWHIHNFQVACIALVFGRAHWIIVKGYDTNADPRSEGDTSYRISGLWIRDPKSGSQGGSTEGYIEFVDWKRTYMTGVTGGIWDRKFLAVCDPSSSSGEEQKREKISQQEKIKQNYKENKKGSGVKKIIFPRTAVKVAMKSLKDRGFLELEFLQQTLKGVKPDRPVLVQLLDNPNECYYIVPLLGNGSRVHSLIGVDGLQASFKQASFATDPKDPINFRPLSNAEIWKLLGKQVTLKNSKKILNVNREAAGIYPCLVWKPCLESLSPLFPFHMIIIGSYRIFIRIDKRVFFELTTGFGGA